MKKRLTHQEHVEFAANVREVERLLDEVCGRPTNPSRQLHATGTPCASGRV
jgi:hypothetical protein